MRNLLTFLLCCLPLLASAADFDDTTRQLPLGRLMQVYEDPDGSASIAQVSSPDFASRFEPSGLNVGLLQSVIPLICGSPPGICTGACQGWDAAMSWGN